MREIISPILSACFIGVTYYTGFKVNSGEYKVMGLAPMATTLCTDFYEHLLDLKEDGTF